MGIQAIPGGGTICTGKGVEVFHLLSLRGAIRLEAKGLKGRINATAVAMREFNILGRATAKNRELALAAIERRLKCLEDVITFENDLGV